MHEILQSERNSEEDLQLLEALYDENFLYADSVVDRLLRILEEKKIDSQTLKIITADHGECLGEHGLVGHNVILYKEGIHIPLIVNIPGIHPEVTDRPAISSDIAVTLADLFELEFPYRTSSRGRNFLDLPVERPRVCRALSSSQGFPGYTIDLYPYKLIVYLPSLVESSELYNLEDDPHEKRKLEGHALVKDVLLYYLYDYLKASEKSPQESERAALREKDLEQLKSLGYIR
jgi:arylsulfatase A-like enzyme